MTAEQILLIRDLRRMLDKRPIDTSRVDIQVMKHTVLMAGTIKNLRSHPLINLKDEMEDFERKARKDSRIHELVSSCRLVILDKEEKQHWAADTPKAAAAEAVGAAVDES